MSATYPVHVDAQLDPQLSRWQWLVKWVLALPHYLVLALLWLAFAVLSVVAFVAILFTGRYPRRIFDFNVGVMRWSWRVTYYAYGALGTDRYPPFSLGEHPEYPAHLRVDYPEHLSRGLVLVKWWLLAIPHYLIVGVFLGGVGYAATTVGDEDRQPLLWGTGLIGLLVLVAAVVLLFTGRYPRPVFDLVLGLNRWVLRVAGYASLMTDQYPPFRLDQGGDDPGTGRLAMPAPPGPTASPTVTTTLSPTAVPGAVPPTAVPTLGGTPAAPVPGSDARQWTAGRVVALVAGCLVLLVSLGVGVGGAVLAFADATMRDDAGFLMSGEQTFGTDSYAIASTSLVLDADDPAGFVPKSIVGDAKITVTPTGDTPLFVGIAASADAEAFLRGVEHATVLDAAEPVYETTTGAAPRALPGGSDIWIAQSSGAGTRSVQWPVTSGNWTVVVMNADGSAGLHARVAAGATVPGLGWLVTVLLTVAAVGLAVAILLLVLALRSAGSAPASAPAAPGPVPTAGDPR